MKRLSWKELKAIAELAGFRESRMRGDHLIMTRPGTARPVVIPVAGELVENVVHSNKRTMELTTKEFDDFLRQVRNQK